eukprot:SM000012S25388  [mRNA]  locus=s12:810779:813001:+ [translate_table: standard]
MSCQVFDLQPLELEPYQIREILRCLLHTVLFNRALGLVRPRDVDLELFDITYVCLSFYEKRNKQMAWFGNQMERLYWEQWCIHLAVVQSPEATHRLDKVLDGADILAEERLRRHAALEATVRETILQILQIIDEKKEHIPPVLSSEVACFPYEITIPSASDSAFGMDMFKRMLQTNPPTMLS